MAVSTLNRLFRASIGRIRPPETVGFDGERSFAQAGEDLIVESALRLLNISKPLYLDIGAYHPVQLSNTYRFYTQGNAGMCVEANPTLAAPFTVMRPRDRLLRVGVVAEAVGSKPFYMFDAPTLSTFDAEEAERFRCEGHEILEVREIPTMRFNDLIDKYFPSIPNFVSMDIEGLDLQVLSDIDFTSYRPEVFCIETLTYTVRGEPRKRQEVAEFMHLNGYFAYADTYINTIFVDSLAWQGRVRH